MPGPNQEDGDVSKRPRTANGVMSRLRRPAGRLRDLPIWSKLGLIMLVPTLATIVVGVSGLVDHIEEASNAERARTLAVLSQKGGGSQVSAAMPQKPCQKFARNRATRSFTQPHTATLGSACHLRDCVGTCGAGRRCEPPAHRW